MEEEQPVGGSKDGIGVSVCSGAPMLAGKVPEFGEKKRDGLLYHRLRRSQLCQHHLGFSLPDWSCEAVQVCWSHSVGGRGRATLQN